MRTLLLATIAVSFTLSAFSNAQDSPSNQSALDDLDKGQQATEMVGGLFLQSSKTLEGQIASDFLYHSLQWTKLNGDLLALYRMEQMLSTIAEPTQNQKDILATQYFFVAQGVLGVKPRLSALTKEVPDNIATEFKGFRSLLDQLEEKLRSRCAQLSPDLSEELIKAAAEMTTQLREADK